MFVVITEKNLLTLEKTLLRHIENFQNSIIMSKYSQRSSNFDSETIFLFFLVISLSYFTIA